MQFFTKTRNVVIYVQAIISLYYQTFFIKAKECKCQKGIITVSNSSCRKVMFLRLSVILFTVGGEVVWADTLLGRHLPGQTPPPRQTPPPQADTPQVDIPGQTSSLDRHPLGRHPLPETATVADGMHPTGMHSCWLIHVLTDREITIALYFMDWIILNTSTNGIN